MMSLTKGKLKAIRYSKIMFWEKVSNITVRQVCCRLQSITVEEICLQSLGERRNIQIGWLNVNVNIREFLRRLRIETYLKDARANRKETHVR